MATNRYVKPNAEGGWDILKEGHHRALLHYDTQGKAVRRARELTRREGGGAVRVMNVTGKIVREAMVPAATRAVTPAR